jgi:predicted transcriptional regulator
MYEPTKEKREAFMNYIRYSIKHPDETPDNVIFLSLSREEMIHLFTNRRIELIEFLKDKGASTMTYIARSLKRELSAIKRDMKLLESLGIVDLEKNGRTVTCSIEGEVLVFPLSKPMKLKQIKAVAKK